MRTMACTWSNETYRFIAERFGEEECKHMKEREYPPIPAPGLFSHLGLYLRTKTLNTVVFLKGYTEGRRSTHQLGVGGLGIAKIVDDPEMPINGFFTSGRVFPVRIRHANLSYDDDRSLDIRGASLKFADDKLNSPLDLVMNTGDRCPFWNGPTVTDYRMSRKSQHDMEQWCFKNSAYYYNAIQGLRRSPSSYGHMKYYSQMTFEMKDNMGEGHLVRFRLIPHDYSQQESGLPDEEDQLAPWEYIARDGDDRKPEYLKNEYKETLSNRSVQYRLQIQTHSGLTEDLELYNMGKVWDEIKCPWNDLAEITIFRCLEDHIVKRTCYNVSHLPDCLSLPESPSFQDYRSIGHLRREVYAASQKGRLQSSPKLTDDPCRIKYMLEVQTAATGRAGYDGTAHVTIAGSRGRTDALMLDKSRLFGDNFGGGESTIFHLEAPDVGDLQYLQFDLDDPTDGWYIEMVTVEKEGQLRPFPAYQWVYGRAIIRTGEGTLPFQDNDELRALRALETQGWRDQLPWHKWESMPSHADISDHAELPRDVRFMDEKYRDFYTGREEGIRNFMLNKFVGIFKDIESFHSFTKFFRYKVGGGSIPAVAERWMWDREFGRQFLQGAHPTAFRQLTRLPANFPVKDEDVQGVLGRGVTLQKEINAGHVYIVDYKILEGIPCQEERCVTPAMALFYVNALGTFLPMAIQLYQNPGPGNPIWTPGDTDADWLCAKLFLKCADAQLHQMQNHLLKTHLVMEPIAIALYRNVSRVHPVFKLLIPHVRYTIAINTIGRRGLIGENGLADKVLAIGKGGHIQLIMKSYREFDFNSLKLPLALSKRGVMNQTTLPGYHYRDDALQLWIAIRSFVGDIINIYYRSDEDIENDEEIQDWVAELHDIGLPQHGLDGEVDHHIPQSIHSMPDLIEFITTIMFTCSCEHAAQNFGQFDYYAFYPNYPMLMRQPPPTEKGKIKMDHLLKTLGHTDHVCVQLATVWLLSGFSEDELYLGDYPNQHFHEQDARSAIHRFQERLGNIEASIDERNSSLEVPYEYLKPSRVPNSIAV